MRAAHRRYNPLLDEWVLCSPERLARPWRGASEPGDPASPASYDPGCYLCPGNDRAGGVVNPGYEGVFVFDNDFSALAPPQPDAPRPAPAPEEGSPLFRSHAERGRCRVVCFSPRHDHHFPDMPSDGVRAVVETWVEEAERLRRDDGAAYVQVFENRGAMMGASNLHPHGQIWGVAHVPTLPGRKARILADYASRHGSDLLGDYLREELTRRERIVAEGEHWVQLVPFWAVWPFETMLIPRRPVGRLVELDDAERRDLAALLAGATVRYDGLFDVAFPYSFGWTESDRAPGGADGIGGGFRLHASYYPPLLRSATVRKFLVGYELTAEPQRDILPEEAAERLRAVTARASASTE